MNVIILAAIVWLVLGWIGLVLLVARAGRNRRAAPEWPSRRVLPGRPSRLSRRIGWSGGATGWDVGHDQSTDDGGGGDRPRPADDDAGQPGPGDRRPTTDSTGRGRMPPRQAGASTGAPRSGGSVDSMSKLRRPPSNRTLLIGALILLNVMLLGGAVKVLLDGRRFLATAADARGVVVDVAKVREYDSDAGAGGYVTRLYPVVEFVTAREQVVRYQPPMGSNPPDYRVGGPLRVLYDPANPQHVVLDTWDELWKESVILLAVGLVLTVITVVVYLVLRSDRAARWLDRGSPGGPHAPT